MANDSGGLLRTDSLTGLEWLAIALVVVTGVLHVYAGIVEGRAPVALAGVGFFGAAALYLADYRRHLLALVGIVYTGVQIPIWYAVKAGEYTTVGYVDKAVQVVLVVLLAYLYWKGRQTTASGRGAARGD
jgi:hypothetical protein